MSDKPREWTIHFYYGSAKVVLKSEKAFIKNEESIDVVEASAYEREKEVHEDTEKSLAIWREDAERMRKERDEARAKNAYLQQNYAEAKSDARHVVEVLLPAERAKSDRLVEALERLKQYADNIQKKHPVSCQSGSGYSLLGELALQVSTDAHYALAEHAKDSPVSAPKFDANACNDGFLKRKEELSRTCEIDIADFHEGARWQFNQIYPQGQSDTPVECICDGLNETDHQGLHRPSCPYSHTECIHDWKARNDDGSICQRCGAVAKLYTPTKSGGEE